MSLFNSSVLKVIFSHRLFDFFVFCIPRFTSKRLFCIVQVKRKELDEEEDDPET